MHASLVVHFKKMRDILAGARILNAVAALAGNVGARFDLVDTRFD